MTDLVKPLRQDVLHESTKELDGREASTSPSGAPRSAPEHAPFRVRRLASGGVLLATHPFRTLWPLWADALLALDLLS